MKRKGIKNLIIDFGGVLIDLDRQLCLENFRKLGLPDVEVMLDLYHQQDFFQKYEEGLITIANGFHWCCSADRQHIFCAVPTVNPI